jgi:hypothetical protein
MASFSWVSRFREGSWLAFRKFMLEERQDVSSRFSVIDAERERIGEVRVLYKKDESGEVTEERAGISVEPQTSYAYDQASKDGDPNLLKYKTSRVGGKVTLETESTTAAIIQRGRKWVSKEIMNKRVRLEERIIKLCDLREQLDEEVEDMVWAMYGDMQADESFDEKRFNLDLTAARIAYRFDSTFRIPEDDYTVNFDKEAEADTPGAPNLEALGGYPNLISDAEEEKNTAL